MTHIGLMTKIQIMVILELADATMDQLFGADHGGAAALAAPAAVGMAEVLEAADLEAAAVELVGNPIISRCKCFLF